MDIVEARRFCVGCLLDPQKTLGARLAARAPVPDPAIGEIIPDVVGVGTGIAPNGTPSLHVLLRQANLATPAAVASLSRRTGQRIEALVVGPFSIRPPAPALPHRVRRRPAPGGISIGHFRITAGTLGGLVQDASGQVYILSNNHVLANTNRAVAGEHILQPGLSDKGKPADAIATLSRFVALNPAPAVNYVDAAIAKPLDRSDVDPDILGLGRTNGVLNGQLQTKVRKSGRTTEVTDGVIRFISSQASVDYGSVVYYFEDQIVVESGRSPFSDGGDSGSLVLSESNAVIGLLFAGNDRFTLVNPIETVLRALGVSHVL